MPRPVPDIPNASMADIAFLLLTFFLVTTTVANDKGLSLLLPPPPEALPKDSDVKIQEKNLFKIQINSFDALLVEGEPYNGSMRELSDMIKAFVQNNGVDPESSDSPEKAIVSFKTDRGTSHSKFIEVLDAAQRAYYEIYAAKIGVTVEKWRDIASDPEQKDLYNKSREGIPMAISIAEPTKVGG
ncbi:MAG: biopolymer transporter ExbD [Cytophagia bacterium]|nr:biopolymer transporter ExbD [Cytophagia bacterium]NBW37693.1 biopolymer transporter ExbD [Cytophagia bacterium]